MDKKYKIEEYVEGTWEYVNGDIIGIDKRTFFEKERGFKVRNTKTNTLYKKKFKTRYEARKFINNKRGKKIWRLRM